MTIMQAVARSLVKYGLYLLLFLLPPLPQNIAVLAWVCAQVIVVHRSPGCQAIHDRIARTFVAAPERLIRLRLEAVKG
jgi:hypothetical protein